MRYEKVNLRDLKHGDQIAVMGNVADLNPWLSSLVARANQTYYHHGIYDAHNMAVIHFTGDNKDNAKPQKSDFLKFFAGHEHLYRVVYEGNEQCLPVNEVMKRAEDAVKLADRWPSFHIIKNNCESFATLLKTGKAYSKQAYDALVSAARKFPPIAVHAALSLNNIGSCGSKGSKESKGTCS